MSYKTKQKDIILNYLMENKDKCFKACDIYDYLKKDNNIGLTTIYRILNNLADTEIIKKYTDKKEAMYQYIDYEKCKNHLHLKCIKCNNIYHLDCDEAMELSRHIKNKHNFLIDSTILGICKECLKDEK